MSALNASTITFLALLCTATASAADSQSNSQSNLSQSADTSFNDRYAALLLHDLRARDGGANLEDSKMTDLTHLIQGVFQANGTNEGQRGHNNVSKNVSNSSLVTQPASSKNVSNSSKVQIDQKIESTNVSTNSSVADKTQVDTNVSKAIQDAVPSLPMASFALEDPRPATNKTEPKFPGNATVQAAWEKKEKALEDEVHTLKARLANASDQLKSNNQQLLPAAAGTFNARLQDGNSKASKKFMVAKGPEPMQPIVKDKKPKADWPTMTSIAAPVGVHNASAVAAPPQKEAIRAQEGEGKRLAMGSAFTGTPAKKVKSVLAMDVTVDHDAVSVDESSEEKSALSSSAVGWFSWLFSWFQAKPPAPTVSETSAPPPAPVHPKPSSLAKLWVKQDSERTAMAVRDEQRQVLEVNDPWSQMEKEDSAQEQKVRGEDIAERHRAEARESPHKPTQAELRGRHGVEINRFWRNLEEEDYNITQTVQSDDLIKYAQLTEAQDAQVSKASHLLDREKESVQHSSTEHERDSRLAIHEPWLRRELRDKAVERQIHEARDLQMLQLRHRHHRK